MRLALVLGVLLALALYFTQPDEPSFENASTNCTPDYITPVWSEPVWICRAKVDIPHKVTYPLTDATVEVYVRRKPLRPAGVWGCLSRLRRDGVTARIDRCGPHTRVLIRGEGRAEVFVRGFR